MTRKKLTAQLIIAAGLTAMGCALLVAGFCVPPTGVIDNSVLVAYGETLTFVGGLFGIDYHYKAKRHIDNSDGDK